MQRRDFAAGALLAPLMPWTGTAHAQAPDWPQRPVRFILSQPAGAGPDVVARYVGDQLARVWGQPVVVENRPGGQNLIGAQAAARAPADGYSFYFATTAAMVTNAFTFKTLPYDPEKDFAPVRLVGRSPFVIATAAGSRFHHFGQVIDASHVRPGSVSIGTEGAKTFSGMLADSVAARAGVTLNHVAYTKAPDAIHDLLGGRVELVCLPEAALSAFIASGQLRALAVSTAQRLPGLADVPSLAERFPGFDYAGWNALFAPAGTPAGVVTRVNRDLEALLRQPLVARRLQTLGTVAEPSMSVPAFEAFMRDERARWRAVVQSLGITAQ